MYMCVCLCVCARACVRAYVRACVRACMRVCVRVSFRAYRRRHPPDVAIIVCDYKLMKRSFTIIHPQVTHVNITE